MELNIIIKIVELVAQGLELFGVAVIGFAFLQGTVLALVHFVKKKIDTYKRFKIYLGKALQLGLEFLVAGDIIRTVSVKPTIEGILSVGLLVMVRTFLNWSITVEIEGCWPWQVAKNKREKI